MMSKSEYVLSRIEKLRRIRRVIIGFGIVIVIALAAVVVVSFIVVEANVIQKSNSAKDNVQSSIVTLTNLITDSGELLKSAGADQKSTLEFREVEEVFNKSTELLTISRKKLDQINSGSAADLSELDELKTQLDDMVVRAQKMYETLDGKMTISNYETSLKSLKTKITDASKLVNQSKAILGNYAVTTVQNEIDRATEMIQTDLTDDEKKTANDVVSKQIEEEVKALDDVMKPLQEKYDKATGANKKTTTSNYDSDSDSSNNSDSSGN
ncbi:hypothetical protein FACS1894125_5870 [Actinomycetota bacterium]|nr:hypothetical protein FACS1894125_5870 [Actinomycetota bacterium]